MRVIYIAYETLESLLMVITNHDVDLAALTPSTLDRPLAALPSPPRATTAFSACREFHKLGKRVVQADYDKFHRMHLAANYRILEWELFIRDLKRRDTSQAAFQFDFISRRKKVRALLPADHRNVLLSRARALYTTSAASIEEKLARDIETFQALTPEAIAFAFPDTHSFLFQSLVSARTEVDPLLIEDGELTLFSLLWLFRQIGEGRDDLTRLHAARFSATDGGPFWALASLAELLEQCGIIVATQSACVPTARWASYCRWIKRHRTLGRPLPVKFPGGRQDHSGLHPFSQTLEHCLHGYFPSFEDRPSEEIPVGTFVQDHLKPWFVTPFTDLLHRPVQRPSAADPDGGGWRGQDAELFMQARPTFFPWEFLLRAWQPFPVHLLIIPIGWSEMDDMTRGQVFQSAPPAEIHEMPHSLAYVTVAGDVPSPADKNYDEWVATYWTLFQGLATEWMIDELEADRHLATKAQLNDAIRQELEPILRSRAVLDEMTKAANELARIVDPLPMETDALAQAARRASSLFSLKYWHDPSQHFENGTIRPESKRALLDLQRDLSEAVGLAHTADQSARVVEHIASELAELTKHRPLGAMKLAKALTQHSVTCVLLGCRHAAEDAVVIKTSARQQRNANVRLGEEDERNHRLREFVTQLVCAPDVLPVSIHLDDGGNHVLRISNVRDWPTLSLRVDEWLSGSRSARPEHGNVSRYFAILLRGWRGKDDPKLVTRPKWDEQSSSLDLKLNTAEIR